MNELRKMRMLREVHGDDDRSTPRLADLVHALGIAALVIFVIAFAGSYPA
jgi:hypothetical protein